MTVLGLDPSMTRTGWAVVKDGRPVETGKIQTDAYRVKILRYRVIRERVRAVMNMHGIDSVACEGVAMRSDVSETLYALNMILQDLWVDLGVRYVLIAPETWRSVAFEAYPSAIKAKGEVRRKLMEELGIKRMTQDEADAFLIGRLGERFWNFRDGKLFEGDLTDKEQKALVRRKTLKQGLAKGETVCEGLLFKEDDQWFDFRRERKDEQS